MKKGGQGGFFQISPRAIEITKNKSIRNSTRKLGISFGDYLFEQLSGYSPLILGQHMLAYNGDLKSNSRQLRRNQTDCEALLWFRLRRKQILGVQFYRQRPIGNYIVDFYAPKAKLVVELDGSQHFEECQKMYDSKRDAYLREQGLTIMRFNNLQILKETKGVMETIYRFVADEIGKNPP